MFQEILGVFFFFFSPRWQLFTMCQIFEQLLYTVIVFVVNYFLYSLQLSIILTYVWTEMLMDGIVLSHIHLATRIEDVALHI